MSCSKELSSSERMETSTVSVTVAASFSASSEEGGAVGSLSSAALCSHKDNIDNMMLNAVVMTGSTLTSEPTTLCACESGGSGEESIRNLNKKQRELNHYNNETDETSSKNHHGTAIFPSWSKFTALIRTCICGAVVALSLLAGRNPKKTIFFVPILSIGMLVIGLKTNFKFETDIDSSFKPIGSIADQLREKLELGPFRSGNKTSTKTRTYTALGFILHASDNNILNNDGIQHLFQVIDSFRSVPEYDEVCNQTISEDDEESKYTKFGGCQIYSLAKLWENNATLYNEQIVHANNKLFGFGFNDMDSYYTSAIVRKLTTTTNFPDDGLPVDYGTLLDTFGSDSIIDPTVRNDRKYVHAYFIVMRIVDTPKTKGLIENGLSTVYKLNAKWLDEFNYEQHRQNKKLVKGTSVMTTKTATTTAASNRMTAPYRIEGIPFKTALADGLIQTVVADLPLMPVAISAMVAFTCIVFFRFHRVKSRTVLALCSVLTIILSILTAFGLLFWIGIPFASTTVIVPFVIIGVGLDDTFIITGHFFKSSSKEIDENDNIDEDTKVLYKLKNTLSKVGISIFVTTLTTSLAFVLGLLSDIPAIRWLVTYAFTSTLVDFVYQITFFIAILVLDERRIRANRCDVFCCFKADDTPEGDCHNHNRYGDETSNATTTNDNNKSITFIDQFMTWYSNQLMKPNVKRIVIIAFFVFFCGCAYFGTQITQAFRPVDLVSEDSDVFRFYDKWGKYNRRPFTITVYFEDVDQSDPFVRQQMKDYITDLLQTESLGNGKRDPTLCWVTEFDSLVTSANNTSSEWFNEQLAMLLNIPLVNEVFGPTIVRDETTGDIIASKCILSVYGVEMNSVDSQIQMLRDVRAVTKSQPVNQKNIEDPKSWSFYTYDNYYLLFEFYSVHFQELISTAVAGMIAVAFVTLIFVPHWSATIFVLPLMITLYIDLLGTLQFCGIKLNVITFVVLVVSIGLLVDFIIHILLAYYESTGKTREGKVTDALRTLGSSICVGGLSTFLCIVPLAGSASFILKTVYICFLAMVVLGISYGLVLLPVILSIIGPINHSHHNIISDNDEEKKKQLNTEDFEADLSGV